MKSILKNHQKQMDVINNSFEYDEMVELEIDDIIEEKHKAREEQFNKLVDGDFKEEDYGF